MTTKTRSLPTFASLLVIVGLALSAPAQPLADRVPQDALLYVGWSGAESMGPGYATSHLKGVIDASSLPQLLGESLPRLMQRLAKDDDEAAAVTGLITAIGGPVWRHPSAFYFGGVDTTNPDAPHPRFALICDAGPDAAGLRKQLEESAAKIGKPPFPIRVEEQGGLVVLAVGNVDVTANAKTASPLGSRAEFKSVMARLDKDPVVAAYANVEGIVAQVDNIVGRLAPPEGKQKYAVIRDALGASSLKRIGWTSGFDDKEWSTQAFVDAPEPRAGVVKFLLDGKPLSDATLRAIPATATIATAGHFDFAGLVSTLRQTITKIDADAGAHVDAALDQVKQSLGLDLQTDILETLGDEWAMYSDPAVGGSGMLGLTLVNRLKDPAKAERAFAQLEQLVNGMIKEGMAGEPVTISFNTSRQGDLTIHYLAIPVIAPSWSIKGGNLYVGLYPQVISGAVEHVEGKRPSILDNPQFAALRKRLGDQSATSVSFVDLPKLTAEGYQEILLLCRSYLGTADLFGAKTPAMALPTLANLMPHVRPTAAVSWTDAAGWHMKDVAPFPGSGFLTAGGLGTALAAEQAVTLGVALPAFAKARINANRVRSASNLRQIGQGMLLYANENKGKLPRELGELLLTQDLTIEVFVNPETRTRAPREKNKEEQAAWVSKDSDYEYLGAGKTSNVGPNVILAHEKIRPGIQGLNMLYGDGHVEWNILSVAQDALAKQRAADMKMMQNPKPAQ